MDVTGISAFLALIEAYRSGDWIGVLKAVGNLAWRFLGWTAFIKLGGKILAGGWKAVQKIFGNSGKTIGVVGRKVKDRAIHLAGATAKKPINPSAKIGGRQYHGHAIDRMQERGIPPSAVENTIRAGTKQKASGGQIRHYDKVNNITVYTNANNGMVRSVGYGRY